MKTHRRISSILIAVCLIMAFASQGAFAKKGKHKPRKPASVEQTHKKAGKAAKKKKSERAPASVKKKKKHEAKKVGGAKKSKKGKKKK